MMNDSIVQKKKSSFTGKGHLRFGEFKKSYLFFSPSERVGKKES